MSWVFPGGGVLRVPLVGLRLVRSILEGALKEHQFAHDAQESRTQASGEGTTGGRVRAGYSSENELLHCYVQ